MLWVLIGEGANGLEIPALLWRDGEVALQKCKEILGENFRERKHDGRVSYRWKLNDVDTDKIFTSYYDGCGECSSVVLKSVEEGMPFVGWDLD